MGAWIETSLLWLQGKKGRVAPYVGAWIETEINWGASTPPIVAPYVGAWIETFGCEWLWFNFKSHPTWVRGLKQYVTNSFIVIKTSHPTWVRGLKHTVLFAQPVFEVAPYVGAWIETTNIHDIAGGDLVAPYVGAWIETLTSPPASLCVASHPTWVRGLKLIGVETHGERCRRTLRGCVD